MGRPSPIMRGVRMLLTTGPAVEGRPIRAYLDVVSAQAILGLNIGKDITAGIRNIVGGRSKSYEGEIAKAVGEVIDDLTVGAEGAAWRRRHRQHRHRLRECGRQHADGRRQRHCSEARLSSAPAFAGRGGRRLLLRGRPGTPPNPQSRHRRSSPAAVRRSRTLGVPRGDHASIVRGGPQPPALADDVRLERPRSPPARPPASSPSPARPRGSP